MEIACSNRVIARNNFGRFIAACEAAATATVNEAIKEGAIISRAIAPVGPKMDPRTVKLKDSISTRMLSATSGVWESKARHALAQEKGAVDHFITGNVNFFWERENRDWVPGFNVISHPGHGSQPFLRPAYEAISVRVMSIARKHYPG